MNVISSVNLLKLAWHKIQKNNNNNKIFKAFCIYLYFNEKWNMILTKNQKEKKSGH